MTQETPSSSSSGPNWTIIAIIAVIVVVVLLAVFVLMNRSGGNQDDVATPTAPAVTGARVVISEPANGVVVDISIPVNVSGIGEGLPEGNVVVEALDAAGNVLTTQATTVVASDAGTGGGGPWSTQLTVQVPPGTAGSIRAYSPSPADGSALAEVSVGVTYGAAPPPAQPAITIEIPLPGEIISEQEVVVVGQGTALPENNVVVRALDANGSILAEQAASVNADLGGTGEWRATLSYSVPPGTPGQISAFSPSPADGTFVAEASVNVQYGMAAPAAPSLSIAAPQSGQTVDPAQVVVSGTGSALPENNVVVRALDGNGAILVEQATTVNAPLGGSGPWSITLAVNAPSGTPGTIDASSTSPADGSIVAQSAVNVVYGAPAPAQPAISISSPLPDETVDPAQIVVSGVGTALPENTVLVRALDASGAVLAEQPATVDAPLGGSGPWTVTLVVEGQSNTPGVIEAMSVSPADGSVMAQASVNVVYGRGRD